MGGDCRADISGGQLSTPGRITRQGANPKTVKSKQRCHQRQQSGRDPRLNQVNSK
ncbi:hypothetical protein BN439_2514 [Erwinia amylovora Ea644]|nr:hypothetical protein BN439_2514 [Erwinia amylovora Ea644]CCP07597.1 hypothetical protein BN440_2578 [Erwinia amylovora MR1]